MKIEYNHIIILIMSSDRDLLIKLITSENFNIDDSLILDNRIDIIENIKSTFILNRLLISSIIHKNLNVIEFITNKLEKINKLDKYDSGFIGAIASNELSIVKYLYNQLKFDKDYLTELLIYAVNYYNLEVIEFLIFSGANIHAEENYIFTEANKYLSEGKTELFEILKRIDYNITMNFEKNEIQYFKLNINNKLYSYKSNENGDIIFSLENK